MSDYSRTNEDAIRKLNEKSLVAATLKIHEAIGSLDNALSSLFELVGTQRTRAEPRIESLRIAKMILEERATER